MKPKFIHNPRNLTYEDSLLDDFKEWVEPPTCPKCREEKDWCECPSEATLIARSIRQECNSMTTEEREQALQEALKLIYKGKAALDLPAHTCHYLINYGYHMPRRLPSRSYLG